MIPPWTTGTFAPSTAESAMREQDILAAADALARAAEMIAGCGGNAALAMAVQNYMAERNGTKQKVNE